MELTSKEIAEALRKWDAFQAADRRRRRNERRVRLEKSRLEMSESLIKDGLNDLKPSTIPARWWWLQSQNKWNKFQTDPIAQGYELLRRLPELHDLLAGSIVGPHLSPLPPERNPTHRPWPTLLHIEEQRFKFGFTKLLGDLGFSVGGGVLVGTKAIIFNCLWLGKRSVAFVKVALECPAPLIVGSDGVGLRERNPPAKTPQPHDHYIKSKRSFASWEPIDTDKPEWIRLPLPVTVINKTGKKRALNDKDILTAFETFLRKPPKTFVAYRARLKRQRGRLEQPKPRTLALGLMAHDCKLLPGAKLSMLADWLANQDPSTVRRFGFPHSAATRKKAFKDFDYARVVMARLMTRAASS